VIEEFDGVEMVLGQVGCFIMGNSDEEIKAAYEENKDSSAMWETDYEEDQFLGEMPPHQICFRAPFWIDLYEVTNAQFRLFDGQATDEIH